MPSAAETAEKPRTWQAESLRITAFCTQTLDVGNVRWWESLTGKEPDFRNARPTMGHLVEQGALENKILQLQIQPGRIDWLLLPKIDPEKETFPLLGDFGSAIEFLSGPVSKWLWDAPPLNRLAFGAQLSIRTTDQAEALRLIAGILKYVKIDWDGIRDLIFQVNRPTECRTLPDMVDINRLAKWQTVVRKQMLATLLPVPLRPVTTNEEAAAYFELDVNTTPPAEPSALTLPPDRLPALLEELIDKARSIVAKGDLQ
jgi:hypothetical protein